MTFLQSALAFVVALVMVACDGDAGALPPPVDVPAPSPSPTTPAAPTPPGQPETRQVTVTGPGVTKTLTVEIAKTDAQRIRGLMERPSMAGDAGMLFLFAGPQAGGFWMSHTLIPLTIAYLDAEGRVLELRDGKPLDETVLTPRQPYRYTLEVNQGWFARNGLGVGAVVSIPRDIAPE